MHPSNQAAGESREFSLSDLLPNLRSASPSLAQEIVDLSAIDHSYDPRTKKILSVTELGSELVSTHQGVEPQLFFIPGKVTLNFYEPEVRVKEEGYARELVPISTHTIDNLTLETLPVAKALVFGQIAHTRELNALLYQLDELGDSTKSRLALDSYLSTFRSMIDHPAEEDRVRRMYANLHCGDPRRPNLGRLEVAQDFPIAPSSINVLPFVYVSNDDDRILRRFILDLESEDIQIQSLSAFEGYQDGLFEYAIVTQPAHEKQLSFINRRIEQGLKLIASTLSLTPEDFDPTTLDVVRTRMGLAFLRDHFSSPVMRFKDPSSQMEMLARVDSSHSAELKTQLLFIGPKASQNKMQELVTVLQQAFPSDCFCSTPDKRAMLEVTTIGMSMLLAHDIANVVFKHIKGEV